MKFRFAVLITGMMLLGSCDNTLDINAPWRETPVVYAVIDMGQDSQYFRIQKTYQNDVNQTTQAVAQIEDSLYMKNITVTVVDNGDTSRRVNLQRVAPMKKPGMFSNRDSSYWGGNFAGFLNHNRTYTLRIKSGETGNEYTGVTTLVERAVLNRPPYNPINIDLSNTTNPGFLFYVEDLGTNAYRYDLIVRLSYTEAPVATPDDTVVKSIDYYAKQGFINNLPPGTSTSLSLGKSAYIDFLKNNIKIDPTVIRKVRKVEYVVVAANRAFHEMLLVNAPSNSIIQKSADYTNISNGIGIFASRTTTKKDQLFLEPTINLINTQILNR